MNKRPGGKPTSGRPGSGRPGSGSGSAAPGSGKAGSGRAAAGGRPGATGKPGPAGKPGSGAKAGAGGRPGAKSGPGSARSGPGSVRTGVGRPGADKPTTGRAGSKPVGREAGPRTGPNRAVTNRNGGNRGARGRVGDGPRRAASRGLGGDQVEGRHAVRELLLAGRRRVREVYLIDDLDQADILEDIVELAFEASVPVRRVSRRHFALEALTESHQGVLARAAELPEADLEALAGVKNAFLLVLDGITDPGNLGAILRTAECSGITGVVLPRHRAVQITPTVTKTAAGAVEHLEMALVGGIPAALGRLHELGVLTIGLEAGALISIFDVPMGADTPVALVLGAEGAGLSRLTRERVDSLASIPMAGRLNSLNVAMAGAVACFEVLRRRQA